MSKVDSDLVDATTGWEALGLDERVLKAIARSQWRAPTLVQAHAVPLALKGRDILAKARTGSGKTGAYLVPIVQRLLSEQRDSKKKADKTVRALVLVPTTELAEQCRSVAQALTQYCSQLVTVVSITSEHPMEVQIPRLTESPDILIATPARLVAHIKAKNISLEKLQMLVVDEADLLMGFGYQDDLNTIKAALPRVCQGYLMSATLSEDVKTLQKLILNTPAMLELEEEEGGNTQLTQYFSSCKEEDKFLLLYVMLKLKLVNGKSVIFVNDIDRCFKLKLFLERFSIKSAVLNAELPQNSVHHIIEEFNRDILDLIIATDEREVKRRIVKESGVVEQSDEDAVENDLEEEIEIDHVMSEDEDEEEDESQENEGIESDEIMVDSDSDEDAQLDGEDVYIDDMDLEDESEEGKDDDSEGSDDDMPSLVPAIELDGTSDGPPKKKRRTQASEADVDTEFGVSRGVDFKNVSNVINFDFPLDLQSYVHRVGRTARAGTLGTAFSFVCLSDKDVAEQVQTHALAQGNPVETYEFKMSVVEGFRYRVEDQLRSITRTAIVDARRAEIKRELMSSKKLKSHFEQHALDLEALKHDRDLQSHRIKRHLRHIPDYLLPQPGDTMTKISTFEENDGLPRAIYDIKKFKRSLNARERREKNPLKSFRSGPRRGQKRKFSQSGTITTLDGEQRKFYKQKKHKKPKRRDKVSTKHFQPTKPKAY